MSPQQNARLQRLLAEAITDTSIEYRLDLQLRISRIVDQAEPLQVEDLHAGVVAWFATGQVDGEDFLISRMRAAIGAAVSSSKAHTRETVLQLARRSVDEAMLAAIDRARRYIKAGHPHGPDATIAELDIVRNTLAQEGKA